MHRFSPTERRRRLLRRHALTPDPRRSPLDAARSMLALHASDPATVYLSVLARSPGATIADIASVLYEDRVLVRLMAMRRTLFVVPADLVPVVHHAAAVPVAERLRRGIIKDLRTLPTDPALYGDVDAWLSAVEDATVDALRVRGTATAAQLSADVPRLRTATLPTTDKTYDVRRNINSRVLTLLGAQGRIVRGAPRGDWTSRAHTWEPAERWWADGIDDLDADAARRTLASLWLRTFGPATAEDLQWWTGWSLTTTRAALAAIETVEVALDGGTGVVLADDLEPTEPVGPFAVLLPGLDPTPMGWKHRDWYLGDHKAALFDRYGNIGPTIWWDGRVVGGWAVHADGTVRARLLEDVGS
ncbi:MAG: winged helix DNA-binding domain-containing protein, partial [Nocardioidaceae bacterium]